MSRFLLQKMWKNKWLVFCLLTANILLVGVAAATPLYNNAAMTRILRHEMRQTAQNAFPAVVEYRYIFNNHENKVPGYLTRRDYYILEKLREIDIPVLLSARVDSLQAWDLTPLNEWSNTRRTRRPYLIGAENFADLITITYGRLPDGTISDNIIEVIATDIALFHHDLLLDELMQVTDLDYKIRVVGIYEITEDSQALWATLGISHGNALLLNPAIIHENLIPTYHEYYRLTTRWLHVLDYNSMLSRRVPFYLEALENQSTRFEYAFFENFSHEIERYIGQQNRLTLTLMVLQIPLFIMLALYIYMVSRQILILEQNEISVLKSRGASRGQIFGLYTIQSAIIGAVGFVLGIALGVAICRFLGLANGFLELVQRAALEVEITDQAFIVAGLAVLFSVLTMLLPVVRFSKTTIVAHKRAKVGKLAKPIWQRFGVDFLCLSISLYALYNFTVQQELMDARAMYERVIDPFLLMGSSLFIIGFGLLCLRIFPLVVKLVYRLGRRFWPPSLYASLLQTTRNAGDAQFIMLFLVFTLAIGIFSAQAARTFNLNYQHEIMYLAGADITFQERWVSNAFFDESSGVFTVPSTGHRYFEPSFERFTGFAEVESVTRVLRLDTDGISGGINRPTQLIGIETKPFGETIWFRDDLLQVHINYYLNVLAANPNGVLLSTNFRRYGISLGDTFTATNEHIFRGRVSTPLEVVGFVERWPGFAPMEAHDIYTAEEDNFLAVANLAFLQNSMGIIPYEIWMRTQENSGFLHNFIQENRLPLYWLTDTRAQLTYMRQSPMVQGISGVLTVNFLVTLFICFSGFLVYWLLSMRARLLQFGIFRALGMSLREVVSLLFFEQILITMTALAIGALVGEIASRLFVPLIQISYSTAQRPIPLLIVMETRDYANLYTVMGIMILLCLGVLVSFVSRLKIDQVLKLGED